VRKAMRLPRFWILPAVMIAFAAAVVWAVITRRMVVLVGLGVGLLVASLILQAISFRLVRRRAAESRATHEQQDQA
jgi:hypothetical protein